MRRASSERGGALLAVLWLSAALSAIAFTVANTTRGETERASTFTEGTRAYYLATGAIERTLFYISLGPGDRNPDGTARYYDPPMPRMHLEFPAGAADVEIIPEASKLNINEINPEELARLLANLGAGPETIPEIVAAILDWRNAVPGGLSMFDQQYMNRSPSFRARHASFEEIEELLLVKGMTPDLFYGSVVRDAQGQLQPRAGLRDCVSVYGNQGGLDINTVQPAVMLTIGVPPPVVAAIVQRRHASPFRTAEHIAPFQQAGGPSTSRLVIGGGTITTLRATARLRNQTGALSDLSRSVSGMYKFHLIANDPPVELLRWYDN
ncbi:MAG TPA: hypothetical protein VEQ63_04585 [Bryobacteraceae bacterium]|nr:hypothetical protein [Bryobacteraceae bacterium]